MLPKHQKCSNCIHWTRYQNKLGEDVTTGECRQVQELDLRVITTRRRDQDDGWNCMRFVEAEEFRITNKEW